MDETIKGKLASPEVYAEEIRLRNKREGALSQKTWTLEDCWNGDSIGSIFLFDCSS